MINGHTSEIRLWTTRMFECDSLNPKYFALLATKAEAIVSNPELEAFTNLFLSDKCNGTAYFSTYNDSHKKFERYKKLAYIVSEECRATGEANRSCIGYIFDLLAKELSQVTWEIIENNFGVNDEWLVEDCKKQNLHIQAKTKAEIVKHYKNLHEKCCRVAIRIQVSEHAIQEMVSLLSYQISTGTNDALLSREMVFWQQCRLYKLSTDARFSYRSYSNEAGAPECWNNQAIRLPNLKIDTDIMQRTLPGTAYIGERLQVQPLYVNETYFVLKTERRTILVTCSPEFKQNLISAIQNSLFEFDGSIQIEVA